MIRDESINAKVNSKREQTLISNTDSGLSYPLNDVW